VLVFMDELPLTATNKFQRIRLSDRLALAPISDSTLSWSRIFCAVCPPKGSSLTAPIKCCRITLDIYHIEQCLRSDTHNSVKSVAVFPVQLDQELAFIAAVTPDTVDTRQLGKRCEEQLHAYLAPKYVVALKELPMRPKTAFVSESNVLSDEGSVDFCNTECFMSLCLHAAFGLSCARGDTVVILHKEPTRWYCECNGTQVY
jgi:hypothetical protein